MNNSRMRIKSAIAFVAVCSGLLMGVAAEAARKPNIILIMTDDQGYGQLGCQGHPWLETPQHRCPLQGEYLFFGLSYEPDLCAVPRGAVDWECAV